MKLNKSLSLILILIISTSITACKVTDNEDEDEDDHLTSTFTVYMHSNVTDAEEANIHIQQISVVPADNENEEIILNDPNQHINLHELINGEKALLGQKKVEPGSYVKLRLLLGYENHVVIDGQKIELSGPVEQELVFEISANIAEDREYVIHLFFDAYNSITTGTEFELDPDIRAYHTSEAGTISGNIIPVDARSRVNIFRNGSIFNTTQTDPETGEFRFIGMEPGNYSLEIIPVSDFYNAAAHSNLFLNKGQNKDYGSYDLDGSDLFDDESWTVRPLTDGVDLLQKHGILNGLLRYIHILAVNQDQPDLKIRFISPFVMPDDTPYRMPISEYGERTQSLAVINGGIAPGGRTYHNYGIIKLDGVIAPYVQKGTSSQVDEILQDNPFFGDAAAGIDDNGNWLFKKRDGERWTDVWPEVNQALAGEFMLIQDGLVDAKLVNENFATTQERNFAVRTHPRTAICNNSSERIMYLIAVDGRHDEAAGIPLKELAEFMLEIGCDNGLNYDGGGSTTMWTEDFGVVNHPTDNGEFDHEGQRNLRNAIIIEKE
ncbi:MAG: phosphodiester glycosidase family protein [Balneolaceae bacterium]